MVRVPDILRRREFAGVALVAASMLALVPAAIPASTPTDPRIVAAVFPPWWSAARSISAAARHAQIVRLGGLPTIVIVRTAVPHHLGPHHLGPDHPGPDQLRADGAWLFLNPIVAGCGPASPKGEAD